LNGHVVLLHGLWMRGFSMGALGRRLRRDGYTVENFDYSSVAHGPSPAIARLRDRVAALEDQGDVHLVAHSLGGLVALEAMRGTQHPHVRNVLCLGSPLRGSQALQRAGSWRVTRALVGRSYDLLCEGVAPWRDTTRVGVIAGNRPYGLGSLTAAFDTANDGTVAVSETELDGITAHTVMAATHSGLVFSDPVARQSAHFLAHGRFVETRSS
jgi:pimeloyl-ACP methyl ester carboxylesterase